MQNIISIENLITYLHCPEQYRLSNKYKRSTKSWPYYYHVTCDIIKQAYEYPSVNDGQFLTWSSILQRLNSHIFNPKKNSISGDTSDRYALSKSILTKLHSWYNNFYIEKYNIPGIKNIPFMVHLTDTVLCKDKIDLVLLGKHVTLVDFTIAKNKSLVPRTEWLYRDFKPHLINLIFSKLNQGQQADSYIRFFICSNTIEANRIFFQPGDIEKTDKVVKNIISGINKGVFNTIISNRCEHCPFKGECSF